MSKIIFHRIETDKKRNTTGYFDFMDNGEPLLRYNPDDFNFELHKDQKLEQTPFKHKEIFEEFLKDKVKQIVPGAVIIDIPEEKEKIEIYKNRHINTESNVIPKIIQNEIMEMTKFESNICQANIKSFYDNNDSPHNYIIVNFPKDNSYELYHYNAEEINEDNINLESYGTFDNLYDAETTLLNVLSAQSKEKVNLDSSERYLKTEGQEFKTFTNVPTYTLDYLYDENESDYTEEELKELKKWVKKNNIKGALENSDNTYFCYHPSIGKLGADCVDVLFETNYIDDLRKAKKGSYIQDFSGQIIEVPDALQQLELNADAICAEYYNGMMDEPEYYKEMSKKEVLAYVYENIYNRLDDGNGTTFFGENCCEYLKLLDDEIADNIILECASNNDIYNKFNDEEKNFTYLTDNFEINLSSNNAQLIYNIADRQSDTLSKCFEELGNQGNITYVSNEEGLINLLNDNNINYNIEKREKENVVIRKITHKENNQTIDQEETKKTGHLSIKAEMTKVPQNEQETIIIFQNKSNNDLYPAQILFPSGKTKVSSNVTEHYIDTYTRPLTVNELSEEKNKLIDNSKYNYNIKSDLLEPNVIGKGYKVFQLREDGNLYPPMVANPNNEPTPLGKWIEAQVGKSAKPSKTGKPRTQTGGVGAGTNSSGTVSLKPGFHIADFPYATNFNHVNPENGKNELFPKDYVYAEVEFSKDKSYQEQAENMHEIPKDGYYKYITNTMTESKTEWNIAGKMKVNRIVPMEEIIKMQKEKGIEQKFEADYVDKIKISDLEKQLKEVERNYSNYKKTVEKTLSKDSKKAIQILNLKATHNLTDKQQNEIIKAAISMAKDFQKENSNSNNNQNQTAKGRK